MIGAADQILDDHKIEIAVGKAGGAEHLQLGDSIIFAVTAATAERV